MTGHGSGMPGIHLQAIQPADVPPGQRPPPWAMELRHLPPGNTQWLHVAAWRQSD